MADVSASNPTATIPPNPTFSPNNITVVFILGGPGAGKGTQCTNLVEAMGFSHLSAGDLLRQEQDREGSEFGDLIREYIREGKIVPMEVTIQLLENAMKAVLSASGSACDGQTGRFLIDGFPRKLDQAHAFEQQVCPAKLVLFFDCPEAELERRLLDRGKTSGRTDDNIKSIKKRFHTFVETSMPVIHYYEAQDKVIRVDAQQPVAAVFKDIIRLLGEHLLPL